VLRMCLEHAADAGMIGGKNPANRTKFPPMRQTAHSYLTAAEVAALMMACGPQGDVVSLLAYTGLRFGELASLNAEDVDPDARRIRVRRSITQAGGKLIVGNPKSRAIQSSQPQITRSNAILGSS
jgi:integrase